jgi:hypothetical protein
MGEGKGALVDSDGEQSIGSGVFSLEAFGSTQFGYRILSVLKKLEGQGLGRILKVAHLPSNRSQQLCLHVAIRRDQMLQLCPDLRAILFYLLQSSVALGTRHLKLLELPSIAVETPQYLASLLSKIIPA